MDTVQKEEVEIQPSESPLPERNQLNSTAEFVSPEQSPLGQGISSKLGVERSPGIAPIPTKLMLIDDDEKEEDTRSLTSTIRKITSPNQEEDQKSSEEVSFRDRSIDPKKLPDMTTSDITMGHQRQNTDNTDEISDYLPKQIEEKESLSFTHSNNLMQKSSQELGTYDYSLTVSKKPELSDTPILVESDLNRTPKSGFEIKAPATKTEPVDENDEKESLDSKIKEFYRMQSELLGQIPSPSASCGKTDSEFMNVDYNASEFEETRSYLSQLRSGSKRASEVSYTEIEVYEEMVEADSERGI